MKVLKESNLSPESEFIKNILIKAKNGRLTESYLKKDNVGKIVEDFNKGELVLTPKNEDDVVLAYNPVMESNGEVITIKGSSTKDLGDQNVIINLKLEDFFKMFSLNQIEE